jgi:hypothetical protein
VELANISETVNPASAASERYRTRYLFMRTDHTTWDRSPAMAYLPRRVIRVTANRCLAIDPRMECL